MQENSSRPADRGGIRASIIGAIVVLAWDAGFTGSCLMAWMVCPIWLPVSLLNSAIHRPGWRLALLRIAIPVLTLGLAIANNNIQLGIAKENAQRLVAACEEYHADNGRFPATLEELVPRYLPSVPRAKYCLQFGKFEYWNEESPYLMWFAVPPFGRKIYDFRAQHWGYVD